MNMGRIMPRRWTNGTRIHPHNTYCHPCHCHLLHHSVQTGEKEVMTLSDIQNKYPAFYKALEEMGGGNDLGTIDLTYDVDDELLKEIEDTYKVFDYIAPKTLVDIVPRPIRMQDLEDSVYIPEIPAVEMWAAGEDEYVTAITEHLEQVFGVVLAHRASELLNQFFDGKWEDAFLYADDDEGYDAFNAFWNDF